ncbi:hypothetical protein [Leptospira alexanderi]|uniref:Uncharacterized protein n=1 Tax=Leptospira alexanderi serovar Manhao 3 str. L 60 TaxID=1049759 RepID=V6HZJ3_9LEPT|nr:hypothetical protein [Leptospira alexanderi]EQA63325.1 hypothetical protein LEP1GSC062_4512 [Leptospira alexanderi serovar Manhao 3 str. L 60]
MKTPNRIGYKKSTAIAAGGKELPGDEKFDFYDSANFCDVLWNWQIEGRGQIDSAKFSFQSG